MAFHPPPMTEEIEKLLTCPISLDFLRDPVILVESEQTLDRKSLCPCLLRKPTRCPVSGQDFGKKLQYIDCVKTLQFLTLYLGENAFQRHDDSDFQRQYDVFFC